VAALSQKLSAKAYVQQVCDQIRWQKAHTVVREELLAHLEDQQAAYEAAGYSSEEAEAMAVREMGSPLDTGSRFDKLYRPHVAWKVLIAVGAIICAGNLLRVAVLLVAGEAFHPLRDLWGLPVGLLAMVFGYWLDYTVLLQKCMALLEIIAVGDTKSFRYLFAAGGLVTLLNILFHETGTTVNGADYFVIANGVYNVAYLALFFPVLFCAFVYHQRGNGWRGFLYSFIFLTICSFLLYTYMAGRLLMLGAGGILLCYGLYQNWFGCGRWWGASFLLYPVWLLVNAPFRLRYLLMLHPFDNLWEMGYMPEYLLTMAVRHWGWWILLPIILLYGDLLWLCYTACRKVKSQLGKFVVLSIASTWLIQLFFYFCNNLSSLYLSSYPLLFVQGNASMICNLFLLGLLLSVYKTGAIQKDGALPI